MKIGSLVQCIYQFQRERKSWGYTYPNKGDILTIRSMTKHPLFNFYLLRFEEINSPPLCSNRFKEIKSNSLMSEIKEIFSQPITQHQNERNS